jgi:hypothetical protein
LPLIAPNLDGPNTSDGHHLDRPNAERWSKAFLEAAGPEIRSCLEKHRAALKVRRPQGLAALLLSRPRTAIFPVMTSVGPATPVRPVVTATFRRLLTSAGYDATADLLAHIFSSLKASRA